MSKAMQQSVVLNVDDDPGARYARGRLLRQAGFEVRDASTGRGALQMLSPRPDLVVLDLNLPDLSGFEVCRRIKSEWATASIPVLHVAAVHVDGESRERALQLGADGYLAEPIQPELLVATVRSLLRVREGERAPRLTGVRVLAVDDNADSRELSEVLLRLHGASVKTAADAALALRLVSEWRPDVIVADIGMPYEDGYEFIARVRALPPEAGERTPAIAWTGYAKEEDRLKSLRAGYQVHIAKPVSADELVWVVARLTGR